MDKATYSQESPLTWWRIHGRPIKMDLMDRGKSALLRLTQIFGRQRSKSVWVWSLRFHFHFVLSTVFSFRTPWLLPIAVQSGPPGDDWAMRTSSRSLWATNSKFLRCPSCSACRNGITSAEAVERLAKRCNVSRSSIYLTLRNCDRYFTTRKVAYCQRRKTLKRKKILEIIRLVERYFRITVIFPEEPRSVTLRGRLESARHTRMRCTCSDTPL